MLDWFSWCCGGSEDEFSPLLEAGSATQPCQLCPTVSVLGRDKDVVFAEVDLKAFGGPYDSRGEYAWSVVEGTCQLSSKQGSRITGMRDTPGDVRVQVVYSIGENRSAPAFHTIHFVAPPVYVIGAGSAGLKAASVLLDQGFSVVLCEATGAVGGRARTVDALAGAFKVDLGCNWLHGDEWRWELESRPIQNLGFRFDDQRSAYPGLEALWNFREDVLAAVQICEDFVQERLATHSQKPASTLLGAFSEQDPEPDFSSIKPDHIDRRVKALAPQRVAEAFRQSGIGEREFRERAISLARDEVIGTPKNEEIDAILLSEDPATLEKVKLLESTPVTTRNRARDLRELRRATAQKIKDQRGSDFDREQQNLASNAALAVEAKFEEAKALVRKETLERCQAECLAQCKSEVEANFDRGKSDFKKMCGWAYEVARAKQGSVEEALEYEQFSNYDREGGPEDDGSDGDSQPAHNGPLKRQQSGQNAWYLGGYGGLLVAYAKHLKTKHGSKLWIRCNTSVAAVCYDHGKLPMLKLAGDGGEVLASAVVVTVSAGVINNGYLQFIGPKAKDVHEDYSCILMGNYKKIVLVFDRPVHIAPVDGAENASTHRPTSVYWHIDSGGRVWKFLVPDSYRKVVIAIVGGALAEKLDKLGEKGAVKFMRDRLLEIKIVEEDATVKEQFVTCWSADPAFCGAYSSTAPFGGGRRKKLMKQPLAPYGVTLAGEALDDDYGSAHAAFLSGERAANSILGLLPRLKYDTKDYM